MPELPEVENIAAALRLNLLGRRLTGLKVSFRGVLSQSPQKTRSALLDKRLWEVHRHGKYLILNFGPDGYPTDSRPTDGLPTGSRPVGSRAPGSRPSSSDSPRVPGSVQESAAAYPAPSNRDPGSTTPGDTHLMIHLRMTGQIISLDDYRPDKHVHLTLDFDGLPVYYRDIRKFGRFTLVDDGHRPQAIDHIGPDMMEVRFRDWLARMEQRRAPIKASLLDQGIAAGLGNIYVDEALFKAGIHPGTAPADLTHEELKRVFNAAKSVLRLAIKHGGTTFLNFTDFHGQPGNFRRKLRVYQRTGEPCRSCGAAIERLVIGGRSSHFCPRCQPEMV